MRILLTTLNSKYIHSNPALKYLYSAAEGSNAYLDVREFTINNEDDYIYGELLSERWDIICFSCYIWNVERILYMAENLKKASPGIKILLGGPEVSFDAAAIMQNNRFVDFIIMGEGEAPFSLFTKIAGETDNEIDEGKLREIPALVYRAGGKIYVNPRGADTVFDSVPFPYSYFPAPTDQIIYYESSRGCPYSCAYCLSSIDKKVRTLSLERVFSELAYFIHKRVKQVKFIDRTFNFDRRRAAAIWKYIIDSDNGVTNFHFEICGDLLDYETIDMLKSARKGLFQFEVGIQSTNRDTLSAVSRSTDVAKTLAMVKALSEMGNSEVHGDLIAGLPFESYRSFKKSFDSLYASGVSQLHLGFLKLLKGTRIREQAADYNYVYREKAPYEVISNRFISAADLVKLKRVENLLELYYNRGGFEKSAEYIIALFFSSPFDFYEELAEFYYMRGYQHRPHKKEDLYRILYKYVLLKCGTKEGTAERAKELLTEDLTRTMNFDAVKKFKNKGWEI